MILSMDLIFFGNYYEPPKIMRKAGELKCVSGNLSSLKVTGNLIVFCICHSNRKKYFYMVSVMDDMTLKCPPQLLTSLQLCESVIPLTETSVIKVSLEQGIELVKLSEEGVFSTCKLRAPTNSFTTETVVDVVDSGKDIFGMVSCLKYPGISLKYYISLHSSKNGKLISEVTCGTVYFKSPITSYILDDVFLIYSGFNEFRAFHNGQLLKRETMKGSGNSNKKFYVNKPKQTMSTWAIKWQGHDDKIKLTINTLTY
jgi:hypothetical protein